MDLFLMFFPVNVAYASIDSFIGKVDTIIINPIITLLFALAVVFFLYGALQFFTNQENEEKKTQGKMHMIWGVVGITVMIGVFGLMNLILNTLNVRDVDPKTGNVHLDEYNPTYPSGSN